MIGMRTMLEVVVTIGYDCKAKNSQLIQTCFSRMHSWFDSVDRSAEH